MNITLNIGLNVSKNYLPDGVEPMQLQSANQIQWQYDYIKDYLEQTLGTPSCIGLAQSATEKTVVVQYSNVKDVVQKLFWLAYVLQQDCIAYTIQDNGVMLGGALVGAYAHEWNYGIFNKLYFIPAVTLIREAQTA